MKLPTSSFRAASILTAALLLAPLTALAAAPQSSGVYVEFETQSNGPASIVKLSLAPDRMRLDTDEGMSIVSIGGDNGKMLMIQHAQKQYMEITDEMMQAMAGMMGQMPQETEEPAADMTPPTFTRTGNTKMVGEWNAYEVIVEHPEQEGDTVMWFSPDVGADFRTLAEQAMASMSSLLDNPMLQMGGGGGGTSEAIQQFKAQLAATDMPDGFPVQIISDAGGTQTTNTLRAIDQNASFGVDTWEAPAGYTKMDMPFIRR